MVTKIVHYRRFEPENGQWGGRALQRLIEESLASKISGKDHSLGDSVDARTFEFPGDSQFRWFIHNIGKSPDNIFGTLCLYSPDVWAAVIRRSGTETPHKSLEETLSELEIAERPPSDGEDFLRAIAYWLVSGNHLFVVQHVALQTKAFEQYFQQLFSAASLAKDGTPVSLRSVFDRAIVGGDLGDITAVEIGGVVPRAPAAPMPGDKIVIRESEDQKSLGGQKVSGFDKAREVLSTLLGAIDAQRILNEVPPEAELEVDVRFGYRTKRRSVSRTALRELAEAARNLPDGEVRAIGRDGKQIGDDLRLSTPMPFQLLRERSSLLQLDDARTKLLRVYQRFVEDRKIEP